MTLYHYTCSHRAPMVKRDRQLHPYAQPLLGQRPLVWLTDLPEPDRQGLGLTSMILSCDRTEWRCTVDDSDAEPWEGWWPGRVDLPLVSEFTFGRRPAHWWVAAVPVAVLAVERVRQPSDTMRATERKPHHSPTRLASAGAADSRRSW